MNPGFGDTKFVGGLPVGESLQSNSGDDQVGFVDSPSSTCPRCPGTSPLQPSECPRCLGTGVHDVVEPHLRTCQFFVDIGSL